MMEQVDDNTTAWNPLGDYIESGETELEEDDTAEPVDAGYVGCGDDDAGSYGGVSGGSGSIRSDASSIFEDNAFLASADGSSLRLASMRRCNPLFRSSVLWTPRSTQSVRPRPTPPRRMLNLFLH